MSNMLENLGAIQNAIYRGDDKHAIAILEGLRSSSLGDQMIQAQIDLIRSGKLRSVGDWLEGCIEQHSEAASIEAGEEILIDLGSMEGAFEIAESDFQIKGSLSALGLKKIMPGVKRDKLKAKLADLRMTSEAEDAEFENSLSNIGFFSEKPKESSDPFAGLMEASDIERNNYLPSPERGRNSTPIASPAVSDLQSLGGERSSDGQYRGEPLLRENSSGITANRGFSRDEKTGIDSAISFIVEEPIHPVTNLGAIRLEAKRLFKTGELDAALDITKKILSRNQDEITASLRDAILQAIEERDLELIGALTYIPKVSVAQSELENYVLDHRAGYLLSMIDGMLTYEDLIDLSGMPRDATLQILAVLLRQEIIS